MVLEHVQDFSSQGSVLAIDVALCVAALVIILCVISSYLVKAAPETLPATTISIFADFVVLPNCFTLGWDYLVLGVGGVQVTNLAGGVGGWWRKI